MQQFTVPQFIDVESKIIGPLTVRQFVIILSAAIICAIGYKLFDFSLFVTMTVIILIIAGTFSFVKVNGRPFHFFILNGVQTLRRPRLRIWNNRLLAAEQPEKITVTPAVAPIAEKKAYKTSRLAELALVVDTKGRYKGE
jgi:hypothetical protein